MSRLITQESTLPAKGRKRLTAHLLSAGQVVVYLPFNLHDHPGLLDEIETFGRLERVRYGTRTALFFNNLTVQGATGLFEHIRKAVG